MYCTFLVDCKWAAWSAWGTCFRNSKSRSRSKEHVALNGGNPCSGAATGTKTCPGKALHYWLIHLFLSRTVHCHTKPWVIGFCDPESWLGQLCCVVQLFCSHHAINGAVFPKLVTLIFVKPWEMPSLPLETHFAGTVDQAKSKMWHEMSSWNTVSQLSILLFPVIPVIAARIATL